jgi:hypothetical protein
MPRTDTFGEPVCLGDDESTTPEEVWLQHLDDVLTRPPVLVEFFRTAR